MMDRNQMRVDAARAYIGAIVNGASHKVAFDLACAAYRTLCPALTDTELRNAVARCLTNVMAVQTSAAIH